MKPVQKRTGSASASSQESHDVTPASRVAAQLDNSTLLPAPAEPTTTVRLLPAPAASRSCSADLVRSVVGSVVGRNFICANRALCPPPPAVVELCANTSSAVPPTASADANRSVTFRNCRQQHDQGQVRGAAGVPGECPAAQSPATARPRRANLQECAWHEATRSARPSPQSADKPGLDRLGSPGPSVRPGKWL